MPRARRFSPPLSVGVLLSGREQFIPYYGGALARWTYEVYSRLQDAVRVTVFGFPINQPHTYPLPHETTGHWRTCQVVSCIPLARRYEEKLWLRALFPRLRHRDVLHIHNRPQWVRILRSFGYHGALVLHLQNNHLGHWSAPMLDELARDVDRLAVCSRFLFDTFAPRSQALCDKTEIIFNGVNTALFFPREEFREAKTILFAGRFAAEKGVLQLVRAYKRVLRVHEDARLVIAGSFGFGRDEETSYVQQVRALADRITRNGKGDIRFTGYLHHDQELPSWFQRATIFCCPSLFPEPFGLVNAEAMACATPVVGANRGGIPQVLGDTGRLVDPENAGQFAGTVSELLSNAAECRRLGRAALIRARQFFDWSEVSEEWIAFLHHLSLHRST